MMLVVTWWWHSSMVSGSVMAPPVGQGAQATQWRLTRNSWELSSDRR